MEITELSSSAQGDALLQRFYTESYVQEFPDENERESLENMRTYLRKKAEGWYGRNNYHILVARDGEVLLGGVVCDYLAEPNAGVIEFLFIAQTARRRGLGKRLHDETERLLEADAVTAGYAELAYVIAEMNDPYMTDARTDNMNPFERASIWSRWGYCVIDFPYVQPALSVEQGSVSNLCLLAKPHHGIGNLSIRAHHLRSALHEYMRWAMRITRPDGCREFVTMSAYLQGRDAVPLLDLAAYIGEESGGTFTVEPVDNVTSKEFVEVMSVFDRLFGESDLAVNRDEFVRAIEASNSGDAPLRYRLWLLRERTAMSTSGVAPGGIAAFYSFPEGAFAGYIGFEKLLRGKRNLRKLVARIERQVLADFPGATGWLIECDNSTDALPFFAVGFVELNVRYLHPIGTGMRAVRLLYRRFGRSYTPPSLDIGKLKALLQRIYKNVYFLSDRASERTVNGILSDGANYVP